MAELKRKLCEDFAFCVDLPPFPHEHLGKSMHKSWSDVWTPDLIAMVRESYHDDFVNFNYSFDPFEQAPTHLQSTQ